MVKKYASYRELKEAKTKLYNDFANDNIYWIFVSTEQELAEELKKLGLKREDVLSIGMGGYLIKEALNDYKQLLKELGNTWDDIKDDDALLLDAFKYELWNHEFVVTYDVEPTLEVFNITLEEVQKDQRISRILKEAINQYLKVAEQWDI